jgi:hypothetical protein
MVIIMDIDHYLDTAAEDADYVAQLLRSALRHSHLAKCRLSRQVLVKLLRIKFETHTHISLGLTSFDCYPRLQLSR